MTNVKIPISIQIQITNEGRIEELGNGVISSSPGFSWKLGVIIDFFYFVTKVAKFAARHGSFRLETRSYCAIQNSHSTFSAGFKYQFAITWDSLVSNLTSFHIAAEKVKWESDRMRVWLM